MNSLMYSQNACQTVDIAERRSRAILQLRVLWRLTESVVNCERTGVHWKEYTISCVCRQGEYSFSTQSARKSLDDRSHSSVVVNSTRLKLKISMLDVYGQASKTQGKTPSAQTTQPKKVWLLAKVMNLINVVTRNLNNWVWYSADRMSLISYSSQCFVTSLH